MARGRYRGKDRIFGKKKLKLELLGDEHLICQDEEEKCLAVSVVKVHGTESYVLMNSSPTPNLLSPLLVKQLRKETKRTNKVGTVANGSNFGVVEKVRNVPVSLDELEGKLDFFYSS